MEFIKKYRALIIIALLAVAMLACCLYIMRDGEGDDEDGDTLGGDVIAEYDVSVSGDGSVKARLFRDGLLDISGTGAMKDMSGSIPWLEHMRKIKTVKIANGVTSVGSYAFYNCTLLSSVELPVSVTVIGEHAFDGSTLSEITLPAALTEIGQFAFDGCRITKLVIPASLKNIGYRAFQNCELITSLTVEEGVTGIGEGAFSDCKGIKSVIIPKSVTYIGKNAFFGCEKLERVTFSSVDGWFTSSNRAATEGTRISVLTDTENALNLTNATSALYWKRNA